MSASNYLEDATLNFWLRANPDTVTAPASVYVSLHTADPTDAGGSEVTGGSYARQVATWNDPAGDGATANATTLTFAGMPTAAVTHWGICDASSAGNLLMSFALTATLNANAGDEIVFDPGDLTVTLD